MKHSRSPGHTRSPAALAAPLTSAGAFAPLSPTGLADVLSFLPGSSSRLDPATAREVVATLVKCMEMLFLPQPATTLENHARCYHEDLPGLSDQELWQEMSRAGFLLAWSDRAQWHPWVLERFERCQQELATNRQRPGHRRPNFTQWHAEPGLPRR